MNRRSIQSFHFQAHLPSAGPDASGRHRVPVAGADEAQKAPLGPERTQRASPERASQVLLERTALPNREDARLLAWMRVNGRNVSRRKDLGMRDRAQCLVDQRETPPG